MRGTSQKAKAPNRVHPQDSDPDEAPRGCMGSVPASSSKKKSAPSSSPNVSTPVRRLPAPPNSSGPADLRPVRKDVDSIGGPVGTTNDLPNERQTPLQQTMNKAAGRSEQPPESSWQLEGDEEEALEQFFQTNSMVAPGLVEAPSNQALKPTTAVLDAVCREAPRDNVGCEMAITGSPAQVTTNKERNCSSAAAVVDLAKALRPGQIKLPAMETTPAPPGVLHPPSLGAKGIGAIQVLKDLVEQALKDDEAEQKKTQATKTAEATNGHHSPQNQMRGPGSSNANANKGDCNTQTNQQTRTVEAQAQQPLQPPLPQPPQQQHQEKQQTRTDDAPTLPKSGNSAPETKKNEYDWKPPVWTMEKAFSYELGKVVINIFKEALSLQDEREGPALRRVGSLEPGELTRLLSEVLQNGDCTKQLSVQLCQQLGKIATAKALTGEEMSEKFAMCPEEKFEMVFGDKATYLKGLVPRIGLPSANILKAIVQDHCHSEDSTTPWTTGNYGITTTSQEELLIVLKTLFEEFESLKQQQADLNVEEDLWKPIEVAIKEFQDLVADFDLSSIEWKLETKNVHFSRAVNRSKNVLLELVERNRRLKDLEGNHPLLRLEEALLCNLYTGPLFEKYNQVHRGGSLIGDNHPYMEKRFLELCHGNRYTTSQFVLTSGMIKLSVFSKARELYRGIGKGLLPDSFWWPNASGSRGGVELGFMSATTDRSVACQYARGSTIQTIFEMATGMIDNGAELDWISQYPHEKEICFPPLTALEVVKTRCEGSQLCVSLRLNLNLTNDTIEKIVGKRKEVVYSLCNGLQQEVQQFLSGPSRLWQNLLRGVLPPVSAAELKQMKTTALNDLSKKLLAFQDHEPEYYNSDPNFLEVVQQSLSDASAAKFCGGKVLLQIAEELDSQQAGHPTWTERFSSMAMCLLEDDFQAKPLELEGTYDEFLSLSYEPEDVEWVFNALGFERWQGLWVEGGPEILWGSPGVNFGERSKLALPRCAGRPLPHGCWLVELEGSRDLDQAARHLLQKWREASSNFELSARFAIAQPRQQKDMRDWWLHSARAGELEAGAARLQRIWTMATPSSVDEECLTTRLLGGEALQAWWEAFRESMEAGILPSLEALRLGNSGVPRNNGPTFCSFSASLAQLKVLDISGCQLTADFAEFFAAAVSESVGLAQHPFQNLEELRLNDNPDLVTNLARPDSFVRSLTLLVTLKVLSLSSCGLDSSFTSSWESAMLEREQEKDVAAGGGGRQQGCWPKLTKLELRSNHLGTDLSEPSAIVFTKNLVALSELEAVDLTNCDLGSSFAVALGSAILEKEGINAGSGGGEQGCWPKLTSLLFDMNPRLGAEPREPCALPKGLVALPVVEELCLSGCGLKDDFAEALLLALSGSGGQADPEIQQQEEQERKRPWSVLQQFRLDWNAIGDEAKSRLEEWFEKERPEAWLLIGGQKEHPESTSGLGLFQRCCRALRLQST